MNETTATPINASALLSAQETEKQLALIAATGFKPDELAVAVAKNLETIAAIGAIPEPPPPVKNVQFYGAVADGKTLNNAAFAKAVASGEIIFDTPGVYLLDGVNSPFDVNKAGAVLRVTVSGVVFKIRPNNQSRSYVCRITGSDCDCDFADATFMGDRLEHSWTYDPDGKWHEHGYGLWVSGARNKVRGRWDAQTPYGSSLITGCTGDGIGVKGPGHDISGFVCRGNRRQGASVFDCADTDIHNNTFEETGPLPGQPDPLGLPGPFAGIDAEPDRGNVSGLRIYNNLIRRNRGSGLTIWVRKAVVSKIDVEMWGNVFDGNTNGNWFKDEASRPHTIRVNTHDNVYANSRAHDIRADQGSIVTVTNNTFDDVLERTDRLRTGTVSPEIGKYANAQVSVGTNKYI